MISRTARTVLVAVLVLASAAAAVLGIARLRVDTGTASFLPAGDPSVAAMEDKARAFGGDPIVVILESAQPRELLLDQQRLLRLLGLEGRLAALPDVAAVYGPATVLNQVAASAQNLLAQIAGRRDALRIGAEQQARSAGADDAAVAEAARKATETFDLRYGALLVQGLPAGLPTLHNSGFVRAVVFDQQTGAVRPQWRFVVPDDDKVTLLVRPRERLDQEGTRQLVDAVRAAVAAAGLPTRAVTITGVPVLTAGLAAEVRAELPLLGLLVTAAVALRFLVVPTPLRGWARLWPPAAALGGTVLALGVLGWLGRPLSFGAVALLPVLLAVGSSFPLYLATLGDRRRVVVTALAAAGGFATLGVSPLPFVRDLALALGVGVLATVLIGLALPRQVPTGTGAGLAPEVAATAPRGARRALALVAMVAVAGVGWVALPHVPVQADPLHLAAGLPELAQARYAERLLGSSGEVSVVLTGSPGADAADPAALDWARRAQTAVVTEFGTELRPVLTVPDLLAFLGPEPTPQQVRAALDLLPGYLSSAVLTTHRDAALMIFGVRLGDLGEQAGLLDAVRAALPPPPPGRSVMLAGLPVAAAEAYRQVSEGRYLANLAGVVVAGVVLAAGLRRRADALAAVAAAVLATGWGLAVLAAAGVALNPLTVALGSLVTVTGAEFVVLLAAARRREGGGSRGWLRRSVALACATSAAGYAALAVSPLVLLREFGVVLTGAVLLSYLGALAVIWLFPPVGAAPPGVRPDVATRAEVPV